MDLSYGEEYEAFREEVKNFLGDHWSPDVAEAGRLDKAIEEIEKAITNANNEISLRRIRQDFLKNLGGFVAPSARQEMTHGVLQAEELEKVTQMHFREYETASQEIMKLDFEIGDHQIELADEACVFFPCWQIDQCVHAQDEDRLARRIVVPQASETVDRVADAVFFEFEVTQFELRVVRYGQSHHRGAMVRRGEVRGALVRGHRRRHQQHARQAQRSVKPGGNLEMAQVHRIERASENAHRERRVHSSHSDSATDGGTRGPRASSLRPTS